MEPIIKVEHLSKRYQIGARLKSYATLRETIAGTARASLKKLRGGNASSKTNETLWALRDVSFEVNAGEVVGIVGRNGAGKSTLLKILSRITKPTVGRVVLHGRVGSLLEVGTGFHPELTGRENIFLNGTILGMSKFEINRKFDEIVEFAEIEKFLNTPVKRYSSGMYMRLAFSVAAHLHPEILVVDEVLAVGDAQFQKKCLGKMGNAAREGRTVLFVSHNMDAVRKLCTRGVLLEQGGVEMIGDADAVIRKYLDGGTDVRSAYMIPPPDAQENAPGYAYKLVVENGTGEPTVSIPVGQAWQVRVHFRITRRTEHFIIALGLRSSRDGIPLRTSWSVPQTIEPGDYEVIFRETKIMLGSGQYGLVVGLSTHERTFHYNDEAGILDIAEYSDIPNLVKTSHVGFLLNPFDISIQKSK